MSSYNPMIAYHAKHELRGWSEVCRYPADWEGWNNVDKSMIKELLNNSDHVLTLGWNMYQIINEGSK